MNKLNKLILKNIDLKDGKLTYNDFQIDPLQLSFEQEKWSFKEDLLQMNFANDTLTLDIGWYPEFDPKGSFCIKVIRDCDWSNPIFKKKCTDFNVLKQYFQEAIDFASCIDSEKNDSK